MLLTNTTKQIRSGAGMDRKTAYSLVKQLGLAETVRENEGENYTRVKTEVLESYINAARGKDSGSKTTIAEVRKELGSMEAANSPANTEAKAPDATNAPHPNTVQWFYAGVKSMVADKMLDAADVSILAELLNNAALQLEKEKPEITACDIDNMMSSILE